MPLRLLGWYLPWVKVGIAAALVVVGGVSVKLVYDSIYYRGWNDAIATVAAQNSAARDLARKAQSAVDRCYDSGGTWDVSTGTCEF